MSDKALHPKSRELLKCWADLEAAGEAGLATGAESGSRGLLGHLFLLGRAEGDLFLFRLAGAHIGPAFGRDLRDHDFSSLWRAVHRPLVRAGLSAALSARAPLCLRATAAGARRGSGYPAEFVFLPLADERPGRLLGMFQPLRAAAADAGPVVSLTLDALFPPEPRAEGPKLRLVSSRD